MSIAGDAASETVRLACQTLARRRSDRIVFSGPLPNTADVAAAHAEALEGLTALRSMAAPPDAYPSSQLVIARVVAQLPRHVRLLLAKRFEEESDRVLHLMWIFLMRNRHVATVAKVLGMHPNTLRYYVERVERRTALNLHETRSVVEASLALVALRMVSPGRFAAELPLWTP